MKTTLHTSDSRGQADFGWLKAKYSFSFSNYYRPDRIHFGVLRVLNDDTIAGGMGFGRHPHDNMEIISIPISGDLEHRDSMGNQAIIREGDIQVMSAGTGIEHSERNYRRDHTGQFLQIWIFPKYKNVPPRYDQISIRTLAVKNSFYQILSPNPEDQGVWIHQDAWFHIGELESGVKAEYQWKKKDNGLYIFVIKGKVKVAGIELNERDGLGVEDVNSLTFESLSETKVLLMEVPMR